MVCTVQCCSKIYPLLTSSQDLERETPAAHPVFRKPSSFEAFLSSFFECLHISNVQIRMVLLKMFCVLKDTELFSIYFECWI